MSGPGLLLGTVSGSVTLQQPGSCVDVYDISNQGRVHGRGIVKHLSLCWSLRTTHLQGPMLIWMFYSATVSHGDIPAQADAWGLVRVYGPTATTVWVDIHGS